MRFLAFWLSTYISAGLVGGLDLLDYTADVLSQLLCALRVDLHAVFCRHGSSGVLAMVRQQFRTAMPCLSPTSLQ